MIDFPSTNAGGGEAYQSTKDPKETQDVITMASYKARGTRVRSAHACEDGTYTWKSSRPGG